MDMFLHLLGGPTFAEEGHKQEPKHVEGRHAGGDNPNGPKQGMAVGTAVSLP